MGLAISAVVGSVALGAYGAHKAGKAQDRATAAGERIAGEELELSYEQLEWAKQKYKDEAPARQAAEGRAQQVSDATLSSMRKAEARADEYEAYNNRVFRPLETDIVDGARGYDTSTRRMAAAESAMSGVDASAAAIRDAQSRELGRAGIAPGSTKALAIAEDGAIAQAKARSAAGASAVINVEQQGLARRMDAASLGRGLPSAQATQQQIATSAGSTSVGSGMQALAAATSGGHQVQGAYGTALGGLSSAGNLYAGIARQRGQQGEGALGGIGAMARLATQQGWITLPGT